MLAESMFLWKLKQHLIALNSNMMLTFKKNKPLAIIFNNHLGVLRGEFEHLELRIMPPRCVLFRSEPLFCGKVRI